MDRRTLDIIKLEAELLARKVIEAFYGVQTVQNQTNRQQPDGSGQENLSNGNIRPPDTSNGG
jgi:hypothetical protein